tara:strand:+ start:384 stop:686 length:303 start_codon:yes stop_codon:yes gene_type:complete
VRRSKSNDTEPIVEGTPWDFASTAANNSTTVPAFADSAATNSRVNNFSNVCELKRNKSKPCECKCNLNSHKATPTNNDVGEVNAPEAPGHQPVKTHAPSV